MRQKRDSMSAEERRAFLLQKNFRVATTPFPGAVGQPIWSMADIGNRFHGDKKTFFVDLESGAWKQAGSVWDIWPAGPWFDRPFGFFERCKRAGLIIERMTGKEGERVAVARIGNGELELHERTESIWHMASDSVFGVGMLEAVLSSWGPPIEKQTIVPQAEAVERIAPSPVVTPESPGRKVQRVLF